MLERAINECPEELWVSTDYTNPFWHVAYHTLYYTNLYLSEHLNTAKDWEKHIETYEQLNRTGRSGEKLPDITHIYSKQEVIDYLQLTMDEIPPKIDATELSAPSGFSWLPFDKAELQLYNIRHIQHHAGQLIERVRELTGKGTGWIRLNEPS